MKNSGRLTALYVLLFLMFAFAGDAQVQKSRGGGNVNLSQTMTVTAPDGTALATFSGSHALVIGQSTYNDRFWRPLPSVPEDVRVVKSLFEAQGFIVETIEDADSKTLKARIETFINDYGYDKDTRLIVYYAGHGYSLQQSKNRDMGYIIPKDVPNPLRDERGFNQRAIAMQQFDAWAQIIQSRHVLFMFDSCFSGSIFNITNRSGQNPPIIDDKISQPVRQIITAGAANETVSEPSYFRLQLEAALRGAEGDLNRDGYVSGTELGMFLEDTVMNYTKKTQHPQFGKVRVADLDKGDFVFQVGKKGYIAPPPFLSSTVSPNMAPIKGGTFWMGSPPTEADRNPNETRHQVTVSDFYMGKYEVTQAEYEALMGSNPSRNKGARLPVESVSWFNAVDYCNALSVDQGRTPAYSINGNNVRWNRDANGYRLPTEAEWEYACRAGTPTPFWTGDNITSDQANYDGSLPYGKNSKGINRAQTTAVGSFKENHPFGLHDMSGNVYEWCWDRSGTYSTVNQSDPIGGAMGEKRILRGGSWNARGKFLRSSYRGSADPSEKRNDRGFRLVRSSF